MMQTVTENKKSAQELLIKEFTAIMVEYITKVSSRSRGTEFTSSQLAKTILASAEMERTRFPIVHGIVKDILGTWEEQELCDHIATTKYSRCRKTKDIYRFGMKGLKEIKKRAIEGTIETIEKRELLPTPIMRTRESLVRGRLEELLVATWLALSPSERDE